MVTALLEYFVNNGCCIRVYQSFIPSVVSSCNYTDQLLLAQVLLLDALGDLQQKKEKNERGLALTICLAGAVAPLAFQPYSEFIRLEQGVCNTKKKSCTRFSRFYESYGVRFQILKCNMFNHVNLNIQKYTKIYTRSLHSEALQSCVTQSPHLCKFTVDGQYCRI